MELGILGCKKTMETSTPTALILILDSARIALVSVQFLGHGQLLEDKPLTVRTGSAVLLLGTIYIEAVFSALRELHLQHLQLFFTFEATTEKPVPYKLFSCGFGAVNVFATLSIRVP